MLLAVSGDLIIRRIGFHQFTSKNEFKTIDLEDKKSVFMLCINIFLLIIIDSKNRAQSLLINIKTEH